MKIGRLKLLRNRFPKHKRNWTVGPIVSLCSPFLLFAITYYFTDSIKNNIGLQNLELDKLKTTISQQTQQIEQARFELQRDTFKVSTKNDEKRIEFEDKKSRVEELKSKAEIIKIFVDMVPKTDAACRAARIGTKLLKVRCSVNNRGVHAVYIRPLNFKMLDIKGGIAPPAVFSSTTGIQQGLIAPGSALDGYYELTMSTMGAFVLNKDLIVEWRSATNPALVAALKKITAGVVTPEEISDLTTQSYSTRFRFETLAPGADFN
ncbi:hypothetical protein GJ698_15155 [Pseudoduganella sp. FT26W]|uniref:Uncharacterized protein n=1 Tax=Duganella aquatilis TaxID=2666082 RepID=A0A844D9J3_9BURK|nr:hypothetical protein [Duganella aquatilis]MRW85422.1 hypothetical protein [Duganella aquatilis]